MDSMIVPQLASFIFLVLSLGVLAWSHSSRILVSLMVSAGALSWFLVHQEAKELSFFVFLVFSAAFSTQVTPRKMRSSVIFFFAWEIFVTLFSFLINKSRLDGSWSLVSALALMASVPSPIHFVVFRKFFLSFSPKNLLIVLLPLGFLGVGLILSQLSIHPPADLEGFRNFTLFYILVCGGLSALCSILGSSSRFHFSWLITSLMVLLLYVFVSPNIETGMAPLCGLLILCFFGVLGPYLVNQSIWKVQMPLALSSVFLFGLGFQAIAQELLGLDVQIKDIVTLNLFLVLVVIGLSIGRNLTRWRNNAYSFPGPYLAIFGAATIGLLAIFFGGLA